MKFTEWLDTNNGLEAVALVDNCAGCERALEIAWKDARVDLLESLENGGFLVATK